VALPPADGSRPADPGRPGLVGAVVFALLSLFLIATATLTPVGHAAGVRGAAAAARARR
jgi:hypothetical protein